jgi:CheY-like chemotaxis protein
VLVIEDDAPRLVVDDDKASLRLMAAALTQLGFRAVGLQSAEEALRAAANQLRWRRMSERGCPGRYRRSCARATAAFPRCSTTCAGFFPQDRVR